MNVNVIFPSPYGLVSPMMHMHVYPFWQMKKQINGQLQEMEDLHTSILEDMSASKGNLLDNDALMQV